MKVPMIPQMMLILQIRPGMDLIMGIVMQVPGGTVWTGWTVFDLERGTV